MSSFALSSFVRERTNPEWKKVQVPKASGVHALEPVGEDTQGSKKPASVAWTGGEERAGELPSISGITDEVSISGVNENTWENNCNS